MLKTFLLAAFVLSALIITGCASVSTPSTTAAPRGTPLGDTGFRVSGTLESGASTVAR